MNQKPAPVDVNPEIVLVLKLTNEESDALFEAITNFQEFVCDIDIDYPDDKEYQGIAYEQYDLLDSVLKKMGRLEIEENGEIKKLTEEPIQEIASRCPATTQTTGVSGDKWGARCALKKGHAGSHKRGKIMWN